MTAIVSSYLPEGFVIGADGLRQDLRDVVTGHAQKIFPIEQTGMTCAYAWAGHSRICYTDRPHFDFSEQSQLVIADLVKTGVWSLEEYAERFARAFNDRLLRHNGVFQIPGRGPRGNGIARILFVGYASGGAARVEFSFSCEKGITRAQMSDAKLAFGDFEFKVFSGSPIVLDGTNLEGCVSLNGCGEAIQQYIQRCSDNKVDPYCRDIGGHIHIATVTPEKFEWIIPPYRQCS